MRLASGVVGEVSGGSGAVMTVVAGRRRPAGLAATGGGLRGTKDNCGSRCRPLRSKETKWNCTVTTPASMRAMASSRHERQEGGTLDLRVVAAPLV